MISRLQLWHLVVLYAFVIYRGWARIFFQLVNIDYFNLRIYEVVLYLELIHEGKTPIRTIDDFISPVAYNEFEQFKKDFGLVH